MEPNYRSKRTKKTGWGAKGLAGHTAMAIGNNFFDYGPDYDQEKLKTFNENEYQADLNKDGDMDDSVTIYCSYISSTS